MIIFLSLSVLCVVLFSVFLFVHAHHRQTLDDLHKQLSVKDAQLFFRDKDAEIRNQFLDYVFRTFNLHLSNPYMTQHSFNENRCLFCFYPDYAGHAKDCAWVHCRPLTAELYPVTIIPVPDVAAAADTIITEPESDEPDEPNPLAWEVQ